MTKKKYITNKDLYMEIIVSKEMGKLSKEAERMLILLGKKLISKFSYQNPDDKFDCLQNGYIQMFANWHSFDEMKGTNAFAYFSEVFKRGAAAGWNKMYKLRGDENAKLISIDGYNDDGSRYDRF